MERRGGVKSPRDQLALERGNDFLDQFMAEARAGSLCNLEGLHQLLQSRHPSSPLHRAVLAEL